MDHITPNQRNQGHRRSLIVTIAHNTIESEALITLQAIQGSVIDDVASSGMTDQSDSGVRFDVTILGSETEMSPLLRNCILETMKSCSKRNIPTFLRLLRVDLHAPWLSSFLLAIIGETEENDKRDAITISGLDMELPFDANQFPPSLVKCLAAWLRSNQLLSLKIMSGFLQLGSVHQAPIINAMEQNSSLTELWLDAQISPNSSSKRLWKSFLCKPNLREVMWLGANAGFEEAIAIREVLAKGHCPIRKLSLIVRGAPSDMIWNDANWQNHSIETLNIFFHGVDACQDHHLPLILVSFSNLRELRLLGSSIRTLRLPPPCRHHLLPKELSTLEMSTSIMTDQWRIREGENSTQQTSISGYVVPDTFYRSILQYATAFPKIRIHGFQHHSRILLDFPKWIARQEHIPLTVWPRLFTLLSCLNQQDAVAPTKALASPRRATRLSSHDELYLVFQQYLSFHACGLVPSLNESDEGAADQKELRRPSRLLGLKCEPLQSLSEPPTKNRKIRIDITQHLSPTKERASFVLPTDAIEF